MINLLRFLFTILFVSLNINVYAQETIRPPDAVTAINAPVSSHNFSIPVSTVPPDEFSKVQFRNIEGIEASFINQSWAGMFQTSSIRPPDPHGCAGPSGIIQTVNLRVAYYTKTGTQTWIDDMGGAGNFFPSSTGGNLSDPRALYDHNSQRYYVMVQENSTTQAFLNLAVSKDNNPSTSTTTEWWFYRFNITETIGATNYGADYPGFGFDGQAIYTTFNMYPLPLSGSPKNCQIIIARKDSAIAGTLNYVRRVYTPDGSSNGFTLQPGTVMSATSPTNKAYFADIDFGYNDSVRIWALNNPITTPSLTSKKVGIPNHGGFKSGAPQLGTATTLATLSPRTQGNAFWYNGALWFCHTAGGGSSTSKVYYYKVNTNNFVDANPTLAESGFIDGETGVWTFQPSIGANTYGDVCLVYSESSSSKYPQIKFTTRKSTATTWDTPQLLKASPSYSNSDRWGDYASVTPDPTDYSFWVVHEWARSSTSHDWGTWWGNIIPPTTLGITLIPEGFYNVGLNKLNMADTVRAYLRSTTSPYVKIDSAKAVINQFTFTGNFDFANAPSGLYYLSMHHRNTIETWGAGTGSITRGQTILGIDYTTFQSSAWGSNQKLKGTKWCFFSGDVNQDGVVDLTDLSLVDTDNLTFQTGYRATDTNGDSIVDLSDLQIVDINNLNFVSKVTP